MLFLSDNRAYKASKFLKRSLTKYDLIELQLQKIAFDIEYLRKHQQTSGNILYTNKDMLAMLGVTTKTLKKYRNNGYLGYSQVGDKFFYSSEDIALFLSKTHKEAFAWNNKPSR